MPAIPRASTSYRGARAEWDDGRRKILVVGHDRHSICLRHAVPDPTLAILYATLPAVDKRGAELIR